MPTLAFTRLRIEYVVAYHNNAVCSPFGAAIFNGLGRYMNRSWERR
jgi:hypothetical protein